jgi:hypothetical protein
MLLNTLVIFHLRGGFSIKIVSGEAILSSDGQLLPNLGEPFHAYFSAVKIANYFAIRRDSCRANPKRRESLAKLFSAPPHIYYTTIANNYF